MHKGKVGELDWDTIAEGLEFPAKKHGPKYVGIAVLLKAFEPEANMNNMKFSESLIWQQRVAWLISFYPQSKCKHSVDLKSILWRTSISGKMAGEIT